MTARIEQLRLRDLLLLEHIAEHGSLRKVAEALHVTQPAVTQALQGLEQAFGVELVERGRRGVSLTPAGNAALARLRVARREVSAALDAALTPQRPRLRLGSSPMAALDIVPQALAELRRALPEAHVVLTQTSVLRLWAALGDGELDAIASSRPVLGPGERPPPGVVVEGIGTERMVVAASRKHPLASMHPTVLQLAQHRWVLPPVGSQAVAMLDEWFSRAGLPPPRISITSDSFATNLRLASAGDLLTVAPETAVRNHAVALDLRVIATPWPHLPGELVFAYRTSSLDNPVFATLRGCFVSP
ncbi:LysR family transcriptional regulator [Piscinibacter sp. HJYY11]|uniref:LysR family transcriptional regulator n=1 Tax=Piscinibacter sp. HJYY11 TaxID=2801333 RepID=UPI00191D788F|nr:LysR family transcriptional regulator [Piscinibacter sp. HJYY11]MBL0729954.1 LysR family transcriptional regulator [Piscinibacter sp. HJYY11]